MEAIVAEPSRDTRSFQPDEYCRVVCRHFDAVALNIGTLQYVIDPFYTGNSDMWLLEAKVWVSKPIWRREKRVLGEQLSLVSQELEGEEAVGKALEVVRSRVALSPR